MTNGVTAEVPVYRQTYTRNEAARLVGITPRSLRWYVTCGMLHPVTIAGSTHVRYLSYEIEQVRAHHQAHLATLPLPPLRERDYYTHQEAKERLGVRGTMSLSQYVKQGKLQRVYPPTLSHAGYRKAEVDALAEVRRLASFSQQTIPTGLLTRRQAGELLGHTASGFLLHHEKWGRLHPVQLPGRHEVFYHREEVEAFAQARAETVFAKPQPQLVYTDAYTALYAHMLPRLTWYLRQRHGWTAQAAEDLVGTTFLTVWEKGSDFFARYSTFAEQCNGVAAWVKLDMWSEIVRQKAQRHLIERVEQVWRATRIPGLEEVVIQREQLQEWWQRCQSCLSPVERAILVWHMEGLSYAHITERLQAHGIAWTERTVQNYGALALLKVRFREDEHG